jgi:hypothetical protein
MALDYGFRAAVTGQRGQFWPEAAGKAHRVPATAVQGRRSDGRTRT